MSDVTVPTPQECYECRKTFTRDFNKTGFWHRLCPECLKKLNERSAPRDCRFCDGKETVQATYQMESDYGAPYICHTCMKDQRDGYVWKEIPEHIVEAVIERGEECT